MEAVIPTHHLRNTVRNAPRHTLNGNSLASGTRDCTNYTFTAPAPMTGRVIFVDTPGLADTNGAERDTVNMEKILDAAAAAESKRTLAGILWVCKGNENKANYQC